MGSVYAMTPLPQLRNAAIPTAEDMRRARLLKYGEEYLVVEARLEWEDGTVEWVPALACGWTDRLVFVKFTHDGWQPVQRWLPAEDVRRRPMNDDNDDRGER